MNGLFKGAFISASFGTIMEKNLLSHLKKNTIHNYDC